ncbi:MAG: hypothetical protein H8E46_05295 [FCB group bacterium]|nr:hypothetical protein [FCB group bacterium]
MSIWKEVLTALGGSAILLGTVAWLTKSIITHFLSKDVENFKNQLKAESDKNIEEFKNLLRMSAFEHETKFNTLHEKRAELVADLYTKLCTVRDAASNVFLFFEEPILRKNYTDKFLGEFSSAISAFTSHFEKHRIYFNEETCSTIDDMISKIDKPIRKISEFQLSSIGADIDDSIDNNELEKILREAQKAILDYDLSIALSSIEKEFRELLGVDKNANNNKK